MRKEEHIFGLYTSLRRTVCLTTKRKEHICNRLVVGVREKELSQKFQRTADLKLAQVTQQVLNDSAELQVTYINVQRQQREQHRKGWQHNMGNNKQT